MSTSHNIYIHVPYCMSKCKYCAFFSHACVAPDWDTYTNGIISEIDTWCARIGRLSVPTIFFGGGTPSLMPTNAFGRIMQHLYDVFDIDKDAEVTLESNPGTLDSGRLSEFINSGVNRLSVGVQSFDDARLKFLGRRHSAHDATKLLAYATKIGIRVSGDFIYGLPNDTVRDVIDTCRQINDIGLTHCSMYELTIEPNTPFGKMNLQMPSNEAMADMYCAISETLSLPRYEVSNYAISDNVCKHNQNIWDGGAYIGLGRGAAGRIHMNDTWYEQRGGNTQLIEMSPRTRAIEKVITGLRQVRGLNLTPDVADILNTEFINSRPDLIGHTPDGRIATTKKGMLILDDLMLNLVK